MTELAANADVIRPLFGGALIGLAASWFWYANGRIAGVSGLMRSSLRPGQGSGIARGFLLGLVLAGLLAFLFAGQRAPFPVVSGPMLLLAGGLVGFGTRLGGGCTSGHGVCGASRLSVRSIVATITFVAVGALTVFVVGHVPGPWRSP